MHRTIEAAIPQNRTDALVRELEKNPHVIGFNVLRNASVRPQGDTLLIHVLNRGADDVLRTIQTLLAGESFLVVSSEIASMSHSKNQTEIDRDVDEAIWEEMETGLRHNGRLTPNYIILMALGGMISAVGLVSTGLEQAVAFVAASIIAPGLEPLAKIPLGLVLRRWDVVWVGLKASVVGYGVLAASAAAVFEILLFAGDLDVATFLNNEATEGLRHLKLKSMLVSLAAAAASILMYLAYRKNVIAGPLIALILIPAAAALGMCLVIGEWSYFKDITKRLGADIGMVIAAGLVLIFAKQLLVHKRQPL